MLWADIYTKSSGTQELRNAVRTEIEQNKAVVIQNFDVPEKYSKQFGKLDPSLFIIISGGVKREKDYFDYFKDIISFPRIKIEFFAHNDKGNRWIRC